MKKDLFQIPENKKIRVIIDTDAGCEADDQYAIAHALMSCKLEVMGIMAEHFGHMEGSMEQSYEQVRIVCDAMGISGVEILRGSVRPLLKNREAEKSDAVRFLIGEALKQDKRPLYVLCQGALTNIASAVLLCPEIQDRMQLIAAGGCNYPTGGFEFNTMNDPCAFNVIMNSHVPVWMIPEEVYASMQTSMMELKRRTEPYGKIGACLYNRTQESLKRLAQSVPADPDASEFETAVSFPNGESWCLGDSAVLGPLLMHCAGNRKEVTAPNVLPDGTYIIPDHNRKICWYTSINQRFLLEDFFSKLLYYFENDIIQP